VHPPVQLDYVSLSFPFQLLLFEVIPYPKNPGSVKDDSNFKKAKLDRIFEFADFAVVCVRTKYWYTTFWGRPSCKTQGRMKTNKQSCLCRTLLASAAPGVTHSVTACK